MISLRKVFDFLESMNKGKRYLCKVLIVSSNSYLFSVVIPLCDCLNSHASEALLVMNSTFL